MKGGREHRVPLTEAAIELLRATAGTGYLFHGGKVGAPSPTWRCSVCCAE